MSTTAAEPTAGHRPRTTLLDRQRAGTITIVGSAVGIACAAGILLTPPMVPSSRFSYPFDETWFVVTQLLFVLQHLAMIAGVLGLAGLTPPSSRIWRPALFMAGVGFVLLTVCELFAVAAATASNDSSIGQAVAAGYGLPTILVGLGFVLAGWVVGRRRLLPWGRWLPLAFGVWVFVILMPALFGPLIAGRLALAGWMALYLLLGVALRARAAE